MYPFERKWAQNLPITTIRSYSFQTNKNFSSDVQNEDSSKSHWTLIFLFFYSPNNAPPPKKKKINNNNNTGGLTRRNPQMWKISLKNGLTGNFTRGLQGEAWQNKGYKKAPKFPYVLGRQHDPENQTSALRYSSSKAKKEARIVIQKEQSNVRGERDVKSSHSIRTGKTTNPTLIASAGLQLRWHSLASSALFQVEN